MAYPDDISDCIAPIESLTEIDIVDYDRIQQIVIEANKATDEGSILARMQNMRDYVCACSDNSKEILSHQLTNVDNGLRQVLIGLEDEVNENETVVLNRTKTMKLII